MYDTFFGFTTRPFTSTPQVEQYFPATTIEEARQTLARCVERGEGAGMLVGPSGTGKSLLCQVLAEQFRDTFCVALLCNGRLSTRRALFQAILYELGKAYRGMDEGEARLALIDYLTNHEDCPRGMVLLVDEAHTLPLRLLEELRMLTNLGRRGEPLVRLILAGASELEERFANPRLDSFNQRLVARCYLDSFNRAETQDYIQSGINAVGGDGEQILSESACHSVHQVTGGVARLINQLCDHALRSTYAAGQFQVELACVEVAWAELQQLPIPSNNVNHEENTNGGDVIEFGGLEDMPDDIETSQYCKEPADEQAMTIEEDFSPEDCIPVEFDSDEFSDEVSEAFVADELITEPMATEATEPTATEATVPDEPAIEETIEETVEETGSPQPLRISEEIECPQTGDAAPHVEPAAEPPRELQYVELLLSDVEDSDVEGSDVEGSDVEGSDVENGDVENGDVENDFQPAGTIGLESQIVCEESAYPFNEKFVVEEIIADRYSSLPESPTTPQQQLPEPPPTVATTEVDTLGPGILIVEDDYDDNALASGTTAPVHRKEYRKLFAKLRRG